MKFLSIATFAATCYAGDRVSIELYYESQCPGCRQQITTNFAQAFAADGFTKMASVAFVPFGNASESKSSSGYNFSC